MKLFESAASIRLVLRSLRIILLQYPREEEKKRRRNKKVVVIRSTFSRFDFIKTGRTRAQPVYNTSDVVLLFV